MHRKLHFYKYKVNDRVTFIFYLVLKLNKEFRELLQLWSIINFTRDNFFHFLIRKLTMSTFYFYVNFKHDDF